MINRTVAVVGSLLLLLVAVGALQVVAGLTGDDETVEAAFPDVAPYREPTATATPVLLPESDVPGEDIPDIPRYPESVRVAYVATEMDATNTVELEYQTLDPLDPVHEHVRAIVDTFGWSLAHEAFSEDERTFGLSREGEDVQIRLRVVEGRTVISIVYSVQKQPEPEPVIEQAPEPEPEVVTEPVDQPEPAPAEIAEPEPAAPPVQESPPAESNDGESQENKPDDNPGQEKKKEDESEDKQDDKHEQKPDKDEDANKGPGNNSGEGNGPSEDNGSDDDDDDEDGKEEDDD